MLSMTEMFERLGAPLRNKRWSWGAIRDDGIVFLRAWTDQTIQYQGSWWVRLTDTRHFEDNDPGNNGYQERLQHVREARKGATTYLVMCCPQDPTASPRKVEKFNDREVRLGGEIADIDGDAWIELKDRIPVRAVRR